MMSVAVDVLLGAEEWPRKRMGGAQEGARNMGVLGDGGVLRKRSCLGNCWVVLGWSWWGRTRVV